MKILVALLVVILTAACAPESQALTLQGESVVRVEMELTGIR